MSGKYDPNIHHRRSIRLPWYDYSQDGWYFVTMCALGHKCLFGKFENGNIELYRFGRIVNRCWKWLAEQYDYVNLDEYVVTAPTEDTRKCKPLSRLVGAFKTVSTKQINIIRNTAGGRLWQRNYYEHIIRNEEELNHARQYIAENPVNWRTDEENPDVTSSL